MKLSAVKNSQLMCCLSIFACVLSSCGCVMLQVTMKENKTVGPG